MTQFHFRLERVLHFRALELALEEAKLKRLIEEEARLRRSLEEIRTALSELPAQIAALQDMRGADLNGMAAYRVQLASQQERLLRQQGEKRRAIVEQAEVHRKAKQRHQLLVELRSRRYDEWHMEMSRQLDELAHESYLARWRTATG